MFSDLLQCPQAYDKIKGMYHLSVEFWLLWFKLIRTKVDPTLESAKFIIRRLCLRSALQAPVVQRADNFIHRISRYPAEQMYFHQRFWQVFHAIPYLNLSYASSLFTNYRAIVHVKILHTFYLLDSELSSG